MCIWNDKSPEWQELSHKGNPTARYRHLTDNNNTLDEFRLPFTADNSRISAYLDAITVDQIQFLGINRAK